MVAKFYDGTKPIGTSTLNSKLEIGRQFPNEPAPFEVHEKDDIRRVVIERKEVTNVSRRQVMLEPMGADRVLIKNLSSSLPVIYEAHNHRDLAGATQNHSSLAPGEQLESPIPFILTVDTKKIRVESAPITSPLDTGSDPSLFAPVNSITIPRGEAGPLGPFSEIFTAREDTPDGESVLSWLYQTMDVFQRSANSQDFLPHAADAVLKTVGLDFAAILLIKEGEFQTVTLKSARDSIASWRPSKTILDYVRNEKKVFIKLPDGAHGDSDEPMSLQDVKALVAAPIFDSNQEVMGAIYGDRRNFTTNLNGGISELEAKLVELLACGVAAGLARVTQEQKAVEARVQFEQFFTSDLAKELEANPDLLDGHNREVSLLFGDISGFSRICELLDPKESIEWIHDVMSTFSDCVIEEGGVLVDYVGDELFAMWGAPRQTDDHAIRCCRAALEMKRKLPELNERWKDRVKSEFGFGIGVNSGPARVGNVGSRRKFKYGPVGNSVNLASRVQGATKYLRTGLLVTGSTATSLGEEFHKRRLCSIRVVNIKQPVEIYELALSPEPAWNDLREKYESALASFENRDLRSTTEILGGLVTQYPDDGPSVLLLSRAANILLEGRADDFDPIWELSGK